MGAAVSSWRLARAVSQTGQLGVVSGVALDLVLARRLQDGDRAGDVRRALAAFPAPEMAQRVLDRYFIEGGRPEGMPYAPVPRLTAAPQRRSVELVVLGSFVEVWLAKEGHEGLVGINCLEKIQLSTPATLLGAMIAGVDVVLMGAGVPREIPRTLDLLAAGSPVAFPIDVEGAPSGSVTLDLDPAGLLGDDLPLLIRPVFLAIVSAHVLAAFLARDEQIRPDGFVVEAPPAGGHNAPARKPVIEDGELVFGPRDEPDLQRIADLGLPFWVAGASGSPEAVQAALAAGARGVQVGTLFALSTDSGITDEVRGALLDGIRDETLRVRTDPLASPTGFPFKVAQLPGTMSDQDATAGRERLCDLGFLRQPYLRPDGQVGYRCPSEPVTMYTKKSGAEADTVGRACICNGLTATVGLGQTRKDGYRELPIVTLGSDLGSARTLLSRHPDGWDATQVVDWLSSA
ncbi:MAG: nitronate monooxygenase [Actinomycetales bacterium]|nr:nitronate monooxygenase [Actinomycetales bacterium]